MQKIHGRKTAVILEDHQHEKLEEIAKKFGITKSQAHRKILETGLDAYATFKMVGLVDITLLAKKTKKACEKQVRPSLIPLT